MNTFLRRILSFLGALRYSFFSNVNKRELGYCGKNVTLQAPSVNTKLENLYIHDNVSIFGYSKFIVYQGKVVIKENVVISAGLTVVTGNHVATVGVPTLLQCSTHINDVEDDVVIEENVWIGVNVTILSGVTIGRGAIIGAGTVVNKSIPPYAVAVGTPARIVKVVFSKEQMLKHEQEVYEFGQRFSEEYIDKLFATYYSNKSVYGVS